MQRGLAETRPRSFAGHVPLGPLAVAPLLHLRHELALGIDHVTVHEPNRLKQMHLEIPPDRRRPRQSVA